MNTPVPWILWVRKHPCLFVDFTGYFFRQQHDVQALKLLKKISFGKLRMAAEGADEASSILGLDFPEI